MLKLSDIYLGSTDAKNELLGNSPDERVRFYSSFVIPPNLNIDDFLDRQKYYVLGLKGTGKTALLRYISIRLEELQNSYSSFVLFKSEIDEETRETFAKTAKLLLANPNADSYDGTDFESVWRWFIYRKLVEALEDATNTPFQNNGRWESFRALVTSEAMRSKSTGLMRLIPKITKGQVEVSKSPKLELDLQWDGQGIARIRFTELVRKADVLFKDLSPDGGRLNLFFDELELSHNTESQYERDVRLVRDLVISIEKINAIAKAKGFNLCLYGAIRSEVQNAVASLGKEINKPLTDFGAEILWNRAGYDAGQQPLIFVIEQRVMAARGEHNMKPITGSALWAEYFPSVIDGMAPQRYILHNSWYRPRDIVRLLKAAQGQYPSERRFTVQVFESVRKKYSTDAWIEITEELLAKYSRQGIEGIKHLLYGSKQVVTAQSLRKRLEDAKVTYPEAKHLASKASIETIIKDLYRIGVLGNLDRKSNHKRFSFRGDDEVLLTQHLMIHNALKSYLSVQK